MKHLFMIVKPRTENTVSVYLTVGRVQYVCTYAANDYPATKEEAYREFQQSRKGWTVYMN